MATPAGAARRDAGRARARETKIAAAWAPAHGPSYGGAVQTYDAGRSSTTSHGNTGPPWAPSARGTRRRPRSRRPGRAASGAGAGGRRRRRRRATRRRAARRRRRGASAAASARSDARRPGHAGARPRRLARRERDQERPEGGDTTPVAGRADGRDDGPRDGRRAQGRRSEQGSPRPRRRQERDRDDERGRADRAVGRAFRRPARGGARGARDVVPAAAPRPGEAPETSTRVQRGRPPHRVRDRASTARYRIGHHDEGREAARADERRAQAPPLAALDDRGVVVADGVPARRGERRRRVPARRGERRRRVPARPGERRRSGCQCSHGLQHFTACSYACMHQCLYLCICGIDATLCGCSHYSSALV